MLRRASALFALLLVMFAPALPAAAADDAPAFETFTLEPAALDAYTGTYALNDGSYKITFTRSGDRLNAQLTGQTVMPVYPLGNDHFVYHGIAASYRFLRAAQGTVIGVALFQDGRTVVGARIDAAGQPAATVLPSPYPPAVDLAPAVLDAFAGVYVGVHGITFIIARTGEGLTAQLYGQLAYPIFPMGKDRFFYKIVDAELQFARDAGGRPNSIVLHQSGYIFPPAVRRAVTSSRRTERV